MSTIPAQQQKDAQRVVLYAIYRLGKMRASRITLDWCFLFILD